MWINKEIRITRDINLKFTAFEVRKWIQEKQLPVENSSFYWLIDIKSQSKIVYKNTFLNMFFIPTQKDVNGDVDIWTEL